MYFNSKFYSFTILLLIFHINQSFHFNKIIKPFNVLDNIKNDIEIINSNVVSYNNITYLKNSQKRLRCLEIPTSQKWYRHKQRKVTKHQKMILKDYWNIYGLDLQYNETINISNLFPNYNSVNDHIVLDIGFGYGESIIYNAINNKLNYYIGVEIHKAGIASTLEKLYVNNITNVKIIRSDVTSFLKDFLPSKSINEVNVFFPDPWHNEIRDGERRVIRTSLIEILKSKFKGNGILRIATDVFEYNEHIQNVLSDWRLSYYNMHNACEDHPSWRNTTRYELKAQEVERKVWEFEYYLI